MGPSVVLGSSTLEGRAVRHRLVRGLHCGRLRALLLHRRARWVDRLLVHLLVQLQLRLWLRQSLHSGVVVLCRFRLSLILFLIALVLPTVVSVLVAVHLLRPIIGALVGAAVEKSGLALAVVAECCVSVRVWLRKFVCQRMIELHTHLHHRHLPKRHQRSQPHCCHQRMTFRGNHVNKVL